MRSPNFEKPQFFGAWSKSQGIFVGPKIWLETLENPPVHHHGYPWLSMAIQ